MTTPMEITTQNPTETHFSEQNGVAQAQLPDSSSILGQDKFLVSGMYWALYAGLLILILLYCLTIHFFILFFSWSLLKTLEHSSSWRCPLRRWKVRHEYFFL